MVEGLLRNYWLLGSFVERGWYTGEVVLDSGEWMGAIELACYSDLCGLEVLPIVLVLVVIESTELSALLEDLIAGNQVDGECGDNANPFQVSIGDRQCAEGHTKQERSTTRFEGMPKASRSSTIEQQVHISCPSLWSRRREG